MSVRLISDAKSALDDKLLFVTEVPEILSSGWLHVPPSYCGFLAYLCTQLFEGGMPDEVTDERMEMLSLILEAAQQAAAQSRKCPSAH